MQQPNKVRLGGRLKIGLHFSGLVEPLRSTRSDKKSLSKKHFETKWSACFGLSGTEALGPTLSLLKLRN